MIARLVNGILYPCPKQGVADNIYHTNLPKYYQNNPSMAVLDGYYPVRYTEKPEGNYAPSWQLINNEIVQVWTEYTPVPDVDVEKLRADVDYLYMMEDKDLEG